MRVSSWLLVLLSLALVGDGFSPVAGAPRKSLRKNRHLSSGSGRTSMSKQQRRRVKFRIQILLPEVQMTEPLSEQSADRYRQLSQLLKKDIEDMFATVPGNKRVYNMRFTLLEKKPRRKRPKSQKRRSHDRGRSRSMKQTKVSKNSSHSESKSSSFPPSYPSITSTASKRKTTVAAAMGRKHETEEALVQYKVMTNESLISVAGKIPLKRTELIGTTWPVASASKQTKSPTSSTLSTASSLSQSSLLSRTTPMSNARVKTLVHPDVFTPENPTAQSSNSRAFDVSRTTTMFKHCLVPSDTRGEYNILLLCYVNAYSEILKIFNVLGTVFSFAADDVKDKLTIIREYHDADIASNTDHYRTFQNMFAYENATGLIQDGSGAVLANRWIHRALKFIHGLLKTLAETPSETTKPLSDIARDLYDDTMSPFHDWYVRMAAYLAFVSFPSRDSLFELIETKDSHEGRQKISDLASVVGAVYLEVQLLYDRYMP